MDNHRDYINQFCRICKGSAEKKRRMLVSKCATDLDFYYRESGVEFARDNPNCQSQFLCNKCSNNIGKIKKEMNFKRKNPKSTKVFDQSLPHYSENIRIHQFEDCFCAQNVQDESQEEDGNEFTCITFI